MLLRLLTAFTLFQSLLSFGQYLPNPSFENVAGQNLTPFYWYKCHEYSTPDTQPGYWGVQSKASDGNTFTNLITRGNDGPYRNTAEDMGTILTQKLTQGEKYHFEIDLAMSNDWGHNANWQWISYANPVKLRVYLGTAECEKSNLVWESESVTHQNWKTYSFDFVADKEYSNLIMEATWNGNTKYFGNVLIDNAKLDLAENETTPPVLEHSACDFVVPNVFTPNGDGLNDQFAIIKNDTLKILEFNLEVYNRWGNRVYISQDENFEWDAQDMAEGTYYWSAHFSCYIDDRFIKNQKKGWVMIME